MIGVAETFNSANVRIEKMFWIPGAFGCGEAPAEFVDVLSESDPDEFADALPEIAPFISSLDGEGWSDREIADEVAGMLLRKQKQGFLVFAATPVASGFRTNSYSFSWGWTHCAWLYAPSADDLARTCSEWAAKCLAEDREKEAKAATRNQEADHG